MKLLNRASAWKVSADLKTSLQFPVHIIQTEKRPDIEAWSDSKNSVLLIELAGLLSHIVVLTTLLPPLTLCYVAMCTSEAIVDMQIVHHAKYPDHFYTTNTGPNRYIPIIIGWSHLVRDHK